jgi:hypothetical protein
VRNSLRRQFLISSLWVKLAPNGEVDP